jgi:ATP-dependent helicase IRC3
VTQFAMPTDTGKHSMKVTLRDYQVEAKRAIIDAIGRGVQRPAVQLPTGMGKTVLFADVAQEIGYPALVIAHRDELLDQAADKFRQVDPSVSVGKVKADQRQWWTEVVTASIQTLGRPKGLAELEHVLRQRPFKLAIVDEAHHSTADTYRATIALLSRYDVPILGVSATLERGDGSGLGGIYDELVYEKDIVWGIDNGYLSDIRALQVTLKDLNLARVRVNRGDFQDGAMAAALHDAGAAEYAIKAFREHASDRKAIAFTPTVELATEFADKFNAAGISAACVSGETPRAERQRIYRALREGEIRVVANAMVLTEGFDEPSVDCIIVSRPTLSRPLFIQMIGRGLRLFPGKPDCLVLDMVGATDSVRLVTVPNLFGLPTSYDQREGTVLQAVRQQQQEQQPRPQRLLETEAISVDVFTQRKFQWVKTTSKDGSERFVLPAGDGMVVILPIGDGLYSVVHEKRSKEVVSIAGSLSLGYAQGAAEDYLRKIGSAAFAAKNASWRNKPASPKQVSALARWGVTVPVDDTGRPLWTAGEASDELTARIAKKAA